MTDDLTETTDMSNDDTPNDEAVSSHVDLLPAGEAVRSLRPENQGE